MLCHLQGPNSSPFGESVRARDSSRKGLVYRLVLFCAAEYVFSKDTFSRCLAGDSQTLFQSCHKQPTLKDKWHHNSERGQPWITYFN
jgi:hypothetical protein